MYVTQKYFNKGGWAEVNEILHFLRGMQRCYELWGATEDGGEDGYGVSRPQCRSADYLELFSMGMESLQQLCSEGLLPLHKRRMSTIDSKYHNYPVTFINV